MELAPLCRRYTPGSKGPQSIAIAGRDRSFESSSLQRRVRKPSVPLETRRQYAYAGDRAEIAGAFNSVRTDAITDHSNVAHS